MKDSSVPRVPCWILESVLPVSYREAMLGDLIEEYNLQACSSSRLAADVWFWREACRCIPSVIWSLLRRGDWITRLMTALGVWVAMTIFKLAAGLVIGKLIAPAPITRVIVAPILFLTISAAGGCGLARIRREATIFLAFLVMVSVSVSIAIRICDIPVPWWYQAGFLILGPLFVLITPALVRSLKAASTQGCAT